MVSKRSLHSIGPALVLALLAAAAPTSAAVEGRDVQYAAGGVTLKGYFAFDAAQAVVRARDARIVVGPARRDELDRFSRRRRGAHERRRRLHGPALRTDAVALSRGSGAQAPCAASAGAGAHCSQRMAPSV